MTAAQIPLAGHWRNVLRDSEIDRTAKLVGFVISTYMDSHGVAYPSKATIAAGAGLGAGRRAVDAAVDRLEAAGLLEIERSKGRRPCVYRAAGATLTAHDGATLGGTNRAEIDTQRRTNGHPTSHRGATESIESESESISIRRKRANARTFEEYDRV